MKDNNWLVVCWVVICLLITCIIYELHQLNSTLYTYLECTSEPPSYHLELDTDGSYNYYWQESESLV